MDLTMPPLVEAFCSRRHPDGRARRAQADPDPARLTLGLRLSARKVVQMMPGDLAARKPDRTLAREGDAVWRMPVAG